MAAYVEHAYNRIRKPEIFAFMQHWQENLTREDITVDERYPLTTEVWGTGNGPTILQT